MRSRHDYWSLLLSSVWSRLQRPFLFGPMVGVVLMATILKVCVPAHGASTEIRFAWAPPPLEAPETVELGTGPTYNKLDTGRDYVIRLPDVPKLGRTMIEGGRNVVILGGHVTVPAGGETDTDRRGIYIKNATGIVHIEGVLIDGEELEGFDGISISAPRAVVQIVNVRIEGVTGYAQGFHGDVVQPFGGVRELRIDHLTASSSYQGFYLAETSGTIGRADIRNVNLYHLPNEVDTTTYLLWLPVDRTVCKMTYPVTLERVFIAPRSGQDVPGYAVWPSTYKPEGCEAAEVPSGVDWPALEGVTGQVYSGTPKYGDFVPKAHVGIGYLDVHHPTVSSHQTVSMPDKSLRRRPSPSP